MKNMKIQRNFLDIILTDLRPVETPQIYTLENFYDYLISNRFMSKRESDNMKITGTGWHAAPLKYHIMKDNHELREMSYLNPLSILEICFFMEKYEKILLDMQSKSSYSIRYHRKRIDLQYNNSKNSTVQYYANSEEETDEGSGDYFMIAPFRRLDFFQKSNEWYDLNRKYEFYAKVDFNKCFDSIYTHTFNWVIAANIVDAKNISKDSGKSVHVLCEIDKLLQNMNMSMTNGIVVGPEFSRFMAEILLQSIDLEVELELRNKYYLNQNREYTICRYVDDIYVFAQREEDINKILEVLSHVAEKYRLHINENKRESGKLPKVWTPWLAAVNQYITVMGDMIFYRENDERNSYTIKERQIEKRDIISKLKDLFQGVIIEYGSYSVKIVSYCLSFIYKKITGRRNDGKIRQIFNKARDAVVYNLIDLVIYIYSYAPTFGNSQKLLSILHLVSQEVGAVQFKSIYESVINRYVFMLEKGNMEDLVNLILFTANYGIQLQYDIEKRMLDNVEEEANPMTAAVVLNYFRQTHDDIAAVLKIIDKKIEDAVYCFDIYKDQNVFQCREIWWLFVFAKCPALSSLSQSKIHDKFLELKNQTEANMSAEQPILEAKKIICDYMLDDTISNKFINWDMSNHDFMKKVIFKTFERTIFNNTDEYDSIDVAEY